VRVTVDATNIGARAGDEIVQVYAHASRGAVARPVKELRAFERVSLAAGQTKSVQFAIPRAEFATWKSNTQYEVQSGRFTLLVGSSSETVLSGSFDLSNPRSQVAKRHTAQPVSKRTPQTTKKATPQSSQPLGVLPGAAN
jgi:hypothetical protein